MPTINKPKRKKRNEGDAYDRERRRIYDSTRWRRLSKLKLMSNPLCEYCQRRGVVKPAEDVHHIVSFMEEGDKAQRDWLAYDYDNLVSLCKECHQRIHNQK